jgi:hypothetical protein
MDVVSPTQEQNREIERFESKVTNRNGQNAQELYRQKQE